jgi:predicted PurR-regulated permease PerM
MSIQNYLNRMPIGMTILAVVSGGLSYLMVTGGDESATMRWLGEYLQLLSTMAVGIVILGTFIGEILRLVIQKMPQADNEIQYYLEKELHALQQEFAKLSVQYETIARELENLETQIGDLDDTVSNLAL